MNDVLNEERFVAIDVGAANGLLPHWNLLNGVAHVYQVEPRQDACAELERANQAAGLTATRHVVCAGVAATDGPRTLYVSNVPTGTSILKFEPGAGADCADYVDPSYLFPIVEQRIETRRLASILNDVGEPRVDLIKLDIQGAELEALRGLGPERLPDLLGAELEVGMHAFYPEEARFPAIERFMNEIGLELFDVRVARVRRPLNGAEGGYETEIFSVDPNSPTIAARIWEFDAIYFRKKSLLLSKGDAGEVRRMTLVYATYNYYSEAHSLVDKAEHAGIFDATAAAELKQAIVDLHHVATYRAWLANTPFWRRVRALGARIAPRNAPRWCQHMYQAYPNG
ncbi:FkbM family methyltransferase [Methylocystis sp. B8]|uniref:FkbM family methyltransferase n=1 Tax=Methylocystis sp. B8 TaxID=544938 RepID=UPI001484DA31|nr:FkbM family methyltransferase [Methylocystis sp. B8]